MLYFDIEIAKQSNLDPKDYDMMREEIQWFDFAPEYNKIICISYVDSSDSYSLDNKTTILKYNKQGYDELIRYIHKIIWSPQ